MWKAAELSCTSMLWWKQRLCTCQAASNLSPWRHLLYPVTRSEERKLVRDITEKEAGQGQSSARFSPVYCSDVRICWRCWKKRSSEPLHALPWCMLRDCRYTQLIFLGCHVFLAWFPEEMGLMQSCWVCVGVGTHECTSLFLQASPLEILIAFNLIWENTGDLNFRQVQRKWAAEWRGKPCYVPSTESSYRMRVLLIQHQRNHMRAYKR